MSAVSAPSTVLVTGASSGIGAAIAADLAALDWQVIALARRQEKLQNLAERCGRNVIPVVADVTDTESVLSALAELPETHADIDCLINNAGVALGLSNAEEASLDHWETMINVNCSALTRLTRALLPAMRMCGRGHIVNMGSIAGHYPYQGSNVYGATKAFVAQFSLNLRADLVGTGVRCTLIEPGLVGDSEFSTVRFEGDQTAAAAVYRNTDPLTPEDVARTVRFALSQPAHVNINRIELMPECQAANSIGVVRRHDRAR